MTDILPAIFDPKRLQTAGFGKGSVVVVTDECVAALIPCRYNGHNPAITLSTISALQARDVSDVRPKMPKGEVDALLEAFSDEMPDMQVLTCPFSSGLDWEAWATAAQILRALADAADAQSCALKP